MAIIRVARCVQLLEARRDLRSAASLQVVRAGHQQDDGRLPRERVAPFVEILTAHARRIEHAAAAVAEICDRGTAREQRRELRRKIAAVESLVFVRRVRALAGLLPCVAARYAVADAGDAQGGRRRAERGHLHRVASARVRLRRRTARRRANSSQQSPSHLSNFV